LPTSKTFKQLARLSGAPAQRKGPFVRRSLAPDDLGKHRMQRMAEPHPAQGVTAPSWAQQPRPPLAQAD
jgi:hypothetical protein